MEGGKHCLQITVWVRVCAVLSGLGDGGKRCLLDVKDEEILTLTLTLTLIGCLLDVKDEEILTLTLTLTLMGCLLDVKDEELEIFCLHF